MAKRARLSIPTRIFLGFALVLSAFGAVAAGSLYQHAKTAERMQLLHEGYLPLSSTLGEARATQTILMTVLDRVLADPAGTRGWLHAARRRRVQNLEEALGGVARANRLDPPSDDAAAIALIERETRAALASYERANVTYEAVYRTLSDHDESRAEESLARLVVREQEAAAHLRDAWRTLQGRIATLSATAAEQQRQATWIFAVLATLALAVGVLVTWASNRILSPLPRLQERVAAVARGDFAARLELTRDDEFGRLAREFENMVEALSARDARLIQSERLAAIGRMAAHVTHEVRNPLSSIGLNVELLRDELPDSAAEGRTLLDAIEREIDRLTGITGEYLRLARLPGPDMEPEDIGEIVRSVVSFVEKEIEQAGISIAVEVEPDLPLVALDENQIRQALFNLLRNAREAAKRDIALRAVRERGGVRIVVRDDGDGIPREERDRIFDLFFTTKQLGTGLGLPLTQQIVVAHGGSIRCEDAPGGGASFEIWLPPAELRTGAEPSQAEPR